MRRRDRFRELAEAYNAQFRAPEPEPAPAPALKLVTLEQREKGVCPRCGKHIGRGVGGHLRGCTGE